MEKSYNQRFKNDLITLYPGEYQTSSNQILHTIVGTCISVILYSDYYKTGGMNHFMLPDSGGREDILESEAGRYGESAMELLINELMKKGIYKFRLKAKIFGGGRMFLPLHHLRHEKHIGEQNIEFVTRYLSDEGIPVTASDIGGQGGRSLFFFPWDGRVLLKRIKSSASELKEVRKNEEEYLTDITQKQQQSSNVFLFD